MEETYTKGDYKWLGDRIRENISEISPKDYQMLQSLRVSYKGALASVFSLLNEYASRIDVDSVCTYRIKRIEHIISKLTRIPKIQVQRIADIAGCRCIMTSDKDAIKPHAYNGYRVDGNAFQTRYMGQLNFYINVINDMFRGKHDNKTIGLLLCNGGQGRGAICPLGLRTADRRQRLSAHRSYP